VTVVCHDSVDADGFKTFALAVDATGQAATPQACYSGEGAEHWVTANGVASNRVRWTERTTPPPPTRPRATGRVRVEQGAPAQFGYWYVVVLTGFPAGSTVTVVCRDSVDADGFKTFSMRVDGRGAARNPRACYSGEGAEHWVTADGIASNRVRWRQPAGKAVLTKGEPAPFGFWYAVVLSGFPANATVSVVCRDSADPGGFKTFAMTVDGSGRASTPRACYSGDGPEHWVTADGRESNRVTW
jgi:hypothetical protein